MERNSGFEISEEGLTTKIPAAYCANRAVTDKK